MTNDVLRMVYTLLSRDSCSGVETQTSPTGFCILVGEDTDLALLNRFHTFVSTYDDKVVGVFSNNTPPLINEKGLISQITTWWGPHSILTLQTGQPAIYVGNDLETCANMESLFGLPQQSKLILGRKSTLDPFDLSEAEVFD